MEGLSPHLRPPPQYRAMLDDPYASVTTLHENWSNRETLVGARDLNLGTARSRIYVGWSTAQRLLGTLVICFGDFTCRGLVRSVPQQVWLLEVLRWLVSHARSVDLLPVLLELF